MLKHILDFSFCFVCFFSYLKIDFDDVIAINRELSTAAVVADVKERILVQNNVTVQVY